MSEILDFDLLDDVMYLSCAEIDEIAGLLEITNISPLLEYAYYDYATFDTGGGVLPRIDVCDDLISVFRSRELASSINPVSSLLKAFEFIRTPQTEAEVDDNKWASFLVRAQRAAERSGVEKSFAQAIIGTLAEMVENIIWHSEQSTTGIVGYQWSENWFEYVVADAGIGVLNSLRKCGEYHDLLESSDALVVALKNGETRFGKASARGTGFNGLVRNIAKKSSYLRFHSGDASITLDGIESFKNNLPPVPVVRPCPPLQGFVISVACKTPNP